MSYFAIRCCVNERCQLIKYLDNFKINLNLKLIFLVSSSSFLIALLVFNKEIIREDHRFTDDNKYSLKYA